MAEFHANQGHCYANQVVTEFHANQGHLCKSDRYIWKSEYELVGIAQERKEKGQSKETDKDREAQNSGR